MTILLDLILLGLVNLLFPKGDDASVQTDTEFFYLEDFFDDHCDSA